MPKIIENIREKLLTEAKRQVMECGYSEMTIRSVAKACQVGVGTVYNYFPSKDMLVASFMLGDWEQCMEKIREACMKEKNPESVLTCLYDSLQWFVKNYDSLFHDENAGVSFATAFPRRHRQLRGQIAKPLVKVCEMQDKVSPEFLAEFIAESMLTWTLEGKSLGEIKGILLQLF